MATHYDLEEQEQIAQLKHFWARYGNAITWVLIAVLGAYAAWNGWQYWQRKTALEAAVLFDELERAAQGGDADKLNRVWMDMQQKAGKSAQAHHAGLITAKALQDAGQAEGAHAALKWTLEQSSDAALQSVARLRLAALELQSGKPDEALRWLGSGIAAEFQALADDRRGDILSAQGKGDEARDAYRKAWEALPASQDYRRIVEAKLNALGVDPGATANRETRP